jgi:transposase-like protein
VGQCASIECPRCRKAFVVSPHMLGRGLRYHCPFCDLYFTEEESPRVVR